MSVRLKALKSDRRVDVIASHRLAGGKVAVDKALDGLAQKRAAESPITLRPRPNGFLEVVRLGAWLLNLQFLPSLV
jgi:hypothetical protein